MAKVALFTCYDDFCIGIRIMANYLKQYGHEVSLIFFKKESGKEIEAPTNDSLCYEILEGFRLRGYYYDINPWTEKEVEARFTAFASSAQQLWDLLKSLGGE